MKVTDVLRLLVGPYLTLVLTNICVSVYRILETMWWYLCLFGVWVRPYTPVYVLSRFNRAYAFYVRYSGPTYHIAQSALQQAYVHLTTKLVGYAWLCVVVLLTAQASGYVPSWLIQLTIATYYHYVHGRMGQLQQWYTGYQILAKLMSGQPTPAAVRDDTQPPVPRRTKKDKPAVVAGPSKRKKFE